METDSTNIIGIIIGAIVTVGFFLAIGFLLKNRLYKKLREKFGTNEEMPSDAFSAALDYGNTEEEGGARIQIGEKNKNLMMKFKFPDCTIKIPFESMKKVKLNSGLLGGQRLLIKIDGVKKLHIRFKKKYADKLPHLKSFIESK